MSEIQAVPNKFTTIQFTTKDGEKCTATKKDGIVTVVGDKKGVRQIPLDDFMKEFVETLPKIDLVKTPKKDTVQFSGAEKPADKEKTPGQVPAPEEDKSVAINKKNLAIGSAITLISMAGLYIFGRGRWWSKAAKNTGKTGRELVEDTENLLKDAKKKTENVVEDIVQNAEGTVKKQPEIVVKKPVEETPQAEIPKAEPPKVESPKLVGADIPRTGMFEIPTDIMLDTKEIIKIGNKNNTIKPLAFGKKRITIDLPNGINRQYSLDSKNNITMIVERKDGKERWIHFKDGNPTAITAGGEHIELTPQEQTLIIGNKKPE